MINVNSEKQGDAHLLIDNDVISLIDAGYYDPAKTSLIPYLKTLQIQTINHLFVSHPHTDHYGGIDAILESGIAIHNIYYNMPPDGKSDWNYKPAEFLATLNKAKLQRTKLHDISQGFKLGMANTHIEILYAYKGNKLKNNRNPSINDYSVIMRWQVGKYKILFTGDLDEGIGKEFSNNNIYKADILKVPHHGVAPIAPIDFFDAVSPQLNMIPSTVAIWNDPRSKSIRKWMSINKLPYCHNGIHGNVVLKIISGNLHLESDKPSSSCQNGEIKITNS